MTRNLKYILLLGITIIFLTGCKKIGKTYDVYFYTAIENSSGLLTLYLDNKNVGELPCLKTALLTKNDTITGNAIHLKLKTGKYKLVAKDKQGNVKFSGTLIFRFNKVNGSSDSGALEYAMSKNILITRIYFE